MLTYNTRRDPLRLAQYGRNIQRMVNHCLTVEDREQRTQCAYAIVAAMETLNPQIKTEPNFRQILWDHLMIMSDFKLDVDAPFETVTADAFEPQPQPVPYSGGGFFPRHYGKLVEQLAQTVSSMEPSPERDELVVLLANHMKKRLTDVNADGVDDEKVFRDLYDLTEGKIHIFPDELQLQYFEPEPTQAAGKKKRKRKK